MMPWGASRSTSSDHYGIDRSTLSAVGGEARNSLAVVETRIENCQSVIYRNGAADFALTEQMSRRSIIGLSARFVTTGTALAPEPSRGAATRHALWPAAGLPVIFDVDYRPYSWPSPRGRERTYSRCRRDQRHDRRQ
jgi:5-dehydro-2-deoxygluconokinase